MVGNVVVTLPGAHVAAAVYIDHACELDSGSPIIACQLFFLCVQTKHSNDTPLNTVNWLFIYQIRFIYSFLSTFLGCLHTADEVGWAVYLGPEDCWILVCG